MFQSTLFLALATAISVHASGMKQSCDWTAIKNKPASLQCGVEGSVRNPQVITTWTVPQDGSWANCRERCREDSNCDYYSYQAPTRQCRTHRGTILGATFTKGSTGNMYWNNACYTASNCEDLVDVSGLTYRDSIIQVHNTHRSNHSVPNLTWSTTMVNYAKEIAETCVYAHSRSAGDGNYGQNIGAGAKAAEVAGLISNDMYNNELPYYPKPYGQNSPDMSNFEAWGHYSQIVWQSTTQVGCYTQYCPDGLKNTGGNIAPYFTVCNYYPPGNYIGDFTQVKAPGGRRSIKVTP